MTHRHAHLGLFSEREEEEFEVFGSGKSRLVRKLPELLKARGTPAETSKGDTLAKLTEINLTRMTSIDALARALAAAKTAAADAGQVPFVFFDEFDSAYAGAPWGLARLAPLADAGRQVP